MVTSSPTFSIVVPCFNYGRFIATTLQSVVNQGRDDVEIIVVDDASTDDSAAIARGFGDPVRVIQLEQNSGPGAAWGVGLAAARGRYVCKLDADDWQMPGFLARVEREFDKDGRVGLVATGVYLYTDGESTAKVQSPSRRDEILDEPALRRKLLRKFFVRMPGTALRRAAIADSRPRTDLRMGEDWELFLRVLRGWRASLIVEPLAVYRIHPASLTVTSRSTERLRTELAKLLDITRDPESDSWLHDPERRRFALGVAESYLGTVGRRPGVSWLRYGPRHAATAMRLATSEDRLAALVVLRYIAWGTWKRLVADRQLRCRPVADIVPRASTS